MTILVTITFPILPPPSLLLSECKEKPLFLEGDTGSIPAKGAGMDAGCNCSEAAPIVAAATFVVS